MQLYITPLKPNQKDTKVLNKINTVINFKIIEQILIPEFTTVN